MKQIFRKANLIISLESSSCFDTRWLLVELKDSSGGQIMSLPCLYHSTTVLHVYLLLFYMTFWFGKVDKVRFIFNVKHTLNSTTLIRQRTFSAYAQYQI
jgi:hypothetical protein